MNRELKVGDVLVAKELLTMKSSNEEALVIGKEYMVIDVFSDYFTIASEVDKNHYMPLDNLNKYFKFKDIQKKASEVWVNPRFEGVVQPLPDIQGFYTIIVKGSKEATTVTHSTYDEAFKECMRLSNVLGKTCYIVQAITKIEQIPNVTQFKD